MIPRRYIFSFFRTATKIDEKSHTLTPELLKQIHNLIDQLTTRLSLVIVSGMLLTCF